MHPIVIDLESAYIEILSTMQLYSELFKMGARESAVTDTMKIRTIYEACPLRNQYYKLLNSSTLSIVFDPSETVTELKIVRKGKIVRNVGGYMILDDSDSGVTGANSVMILAGQTPP